MSDKERNRYATIAVVLILGVVLFLVLRPYLSMLLLAYILALLFDPFNHFLARKLGGRRSIASLITSFVILLCLVIPLTIVVTISAGQAVNLALDINHKVSDGTIRIETFLDFGQKILDRLPGDLKMGDLFRQNEIMEFIRTYATRLGDFFSTSVLSIVQNTAVIASNFMIFFFVLIYTIQDKDRIVSRLVRLSPLEDEEDRYLLHRFESTARSLIKGSFFIALVQGSLGGLIFYIVGIPSAVFWGMLMILASLIPLGSGIIWTPAAIIMMLTGHWVAGIIIILFGVLVIGTVDNVIRANLMKKDETNLPPILTFLSVLGGVRFFGFLGIIYGPLLAMLFVTALRIYELNKEKAGAKAKAKGRK